MRAESTRWHILASAAGCPVRIRRHVDEPPLFPALKRLLADAELDKAILREAASGNF
jgi:hypothetical protein